MKIIVSHDVDHITVLEHYNDLIVPKFLVRNTIELVFGSITINEYFLRIIDLFNNKWQNIEELILFNNKHRVKSTFFVGVNKGKGLTYSLKKSKKIIRYIIDSGYDVGVHGIDYNNCDKVLNEFKLFKVLSGLNNFGIRMHYLRCNDNTLYYLNKSGYKYDSTVFEMRDIFKIGSMIEFPLHIMDGAICGNRKYGNKTLEEAKTDTIKHINEAENNHFQYLTVLYHDRYFCNSFKIWKDWYIWLIKYLELNKYEFISYNEALNEIN